MCEQRNKAATHVRSKEQGGVNKGPGGAHLRQGAAAEVRLGQRRERLDDLQNFKEQDGGGFEEDGDGGEGGDAGGYAGRVECC